MADDQNQNQGQQGQEGAQGQAQGTATIDYKAEHAKLQEQLKQFEGVDLDRWNKAKDFDFDKAQEALTFKEQQEAEQARLEEEKNGQKPEIEKRLENVEKTLTLKEQQEQTRLQNEWMDKFERSIETGIDQALKADFKDLEELSPQEKRFVETLVHKAYENDAAQKAPKLNLTTVGKVVSEAIKDVKENRAFIMKRGVKTPTNPALPTAQDGALPKQGMTDSQRLEAMVNHYRSQQATT
jgi:hypothetical protein